MSIEVRNIVKIFGVEQTRALNDVSLTIKEGEFVSLTGRSGSGKSTLLYIMSSLDFPTEGTVELAGKNLAKMRSIELHEFRNTHIGFVFQFHYLLPELTALENVLMPAVKNRTQIERTDYAIELLTQVGLAHKLHRLPRQLSGGEQQRVAIARALLMNPKYLFADEPTGSLDSVNGETVMQILKEINKKHNMTIVLVTHESDFAAMAQRQIHLADGKVVKEGV